MIIKVRAVEDWIMIDNVEEIQYADKNCSAEPFMKIVSEKDLGYWTSLDNCRLLFSYDSFPMRLGHITFRKTGENEDQEHSILWRGQLYILSDKGKTVESLFVPY